MKKTFEYDLTKYDPNAPTRTEQFLTANGVKTLITDANDGAVLIQDSVDGDSLNPVTAAAVAAAVEQGGGGGGVPDVAVPLFIDTDDAVALRYGSGLRLEEGDLGQDDTLAVALSGTGGLAYDDTDGNGLAVQLDPDGAIENFIDDGEQVGLRAKVDGTSITINASGQLAAVAPSATLSRKYVSMAFDSGKLTCSGIIGGMGWYIGTLRIGMGSAPVTGPVTGTPICIYGYTDASYSSFCGSGSVINLQYYPVAEIQFMFSLGSGDIGIKELRILDSTGADITATLATDVTYRLEYWKVSH